ncbi:hypothetical protein [Puniceicoccus vermicola]|uniref:Uncharacterized protein n=1 Tax=Puniceicoccus vermicola TaxID=388746 RepID=A0A7X1E3L3_9BACT|nr:hypothetical protein [Puniceicoccus vermicola]MBC2601625.1 hypothetical protein [Puniceicoccus vermicola]
MSEGELLLLVFGFGSFIALGAGFIIDRQVCRKIKEKKGKNSNSSLFLQSLSHSFLLAPSITPLGLGGFFTPFAIGILLAPNQKAALLSLISFASVFSITFCIHLAARTHRLKSEQ